MRIGLVVFLLLAAAGVLHAQSDTITANPNAVKLRRIWTIIGTHEGEEVGTGGGSLSDINGDGLDDFCVYVSGRRQIWIFYGDTNGPKQTPTRVIDSLGLYPNGPVVGDFWGTGHKAIGFTSVIIADSATGGLGYILNVFRTESGDIPSAPAVQWHSVASLKPLDLVIPSMIRTADLDGDGADELVIFVLATRHDNTVVTRGEIRIYKGGPNFQVDTPTVVIRDPEENNSAYGGKLFDLDGDGFIDITTYGRYSRPDWIPFYVYWGTGQLPNPETQPDHVQNLSDFVLSDVDGDGVKDIVKGGAYIYRSKAGKSARTRSFDTVDADMKLLTGHGMLTVDNLGYLNDKRHEMIAGYIRPNVLTMICFSGGRNGPDTQYDATYAPESDGFVTSKILGYILPLRDVNGDGWNDLLAASSVYPDRPELYGAAMILAGGAYIPRDDTTTGIRDIAAEGRRTAVSLWPNPIHDELNIAWRGDLEHMPCKFVMHDLFGREIAHGEVERGASSALWHCDNVASGIYLLSILDERGAVIVTARIVKQ